MKMEEETLIDRTIKFSRSVENSSFDKVNEPLDKLKTNSTLRHTIAAYKGLISHQEAIIKRTPKTKYTAAIIQEREKRIERYNDILANLSLINNLKAVDSQSTFNKYLTDLKLIEGYDLSHRGRTPLSQILDNTIKAASSESDLIDKAAKVEENTEWDKEKVVPMLNALRKEMAKKEMDINEITRIINEWKKEQPLMTLVFMLVLNTETGRKHGTRQQGVPQGTYVLFNIDMGKASPSILFGKMLNRNHQNEKENIYNAFKKKFARNWSDQEWEEKSKSLEIKGYGYVDFAKKEVKVKYLQREQRYVEIEHPARIYDLNTFETQYTLWKETWKKKKKMTEEQWQRYVRDLLSSQ